MTKKELRGRLVRILHMMNTYGSLEWSIPRETLEAMIDLIDEMDKEK